ncbi:hypothetical protein Tco_0924512 [Tanacetum coccineum]|uniref:Uncharacterized protein n=1 Tax=Tanacetum coccineum TaxID=301880 RepID=A0ABQ5D730_9ASTR
MAVLTTSRCPSIIKSTIHQSSSTPSQLANPIRAFTRPSLAHSGHIGCIGLDIYGPIEVFLLGRVSAFASLHGDQVVQGKGKGPASGVVASPTQEAKGPAGQRQGATVASKGASTLMMTDIRLYEYSQTFGPQKYLEHEDNFSTEGKSENASELQRFLRRHLDTYKDKAELLALLSTRIAVAILLSFTYAKAISGPYAKYMAEDASSKKFVVSNFTNYKVTDSRLVLEQYNELLGILRRFTQHKMNMDEAIQDSDKPKGNNVAGTSVVNMVEHNNSYRHKGFGGWFIQLTERMMMCNQMFKLNIVNDNIASAFMSTSKLNDSILCHARLGNVHFKRMQDMS